MSDRTDLHRPLPRLLSPRLPIGRRWPRFCRSPFAGDLRASAKALETTAAVVSGVGTFYVVVHLGAAPQAFSGGVA
ncbi:hypothetical protein [Geodermatophilus marinus]|uniref:hypothetical protein n=1 Tax=Geodermatophilus sp. LHW52908 TaxID=2303986 RepID=UPI000E3DD85E|nr:hypothetical protein [Geodermatophilus sp. LHW52908]RFU18836.1 hypothetical protein D0Z06_24610 [Geodermatophilus sp. LHW52908]